MGGYYISVELVYKLKIKKSFGAKYVGKYTGIFYNDVMDDFSSPGFVNSFGFVPSEANFIRAKKRPLSSMSPLIIVNNEDNVVLVLGASAGSKIVTGIAQVILKKKIKLEFYKVLSLNEEKTLKLGGH